MISCGKVQSTVPHQQQSILHLMVLGAQQQGAECHQSIAFPKANVHIPLPERLSFVGSSNIIQNCCRSQKSKFGRCIPDDVIDDDDLTSVTSSS